MKILGIETSCDETAAAVVVDGTKVLSNVVVSLGAAGCFRAGTGYDDNFVYASRGKEPAYENGHQPCNNSRCGVYGACTAVCYKTLYDE